MSTAPIQPRQYPAMPDPQRVVSRSVAMLKRMGYSEPEALARILSVVSMLFASFQADDDIDTTWLLDIATIVRERYAVLIPENTDHLGDESANGNGSRTGSTA